MKRRGVLLAAVAVLLVGACEDNGYLNDGGTPQIETAGTLKIWRCQVGYGYGPAGSHLFSDETGGDSAKIAFTRSDGTAYSIFTDSTSSFVQRVDEGTYAITIESRWTLPDTISDVYISGDTTFNFDEVFLVVNPTDMRIVFWYKDRDTLGVRWEWEQIRKMDQFTGNKLAVRGLLPSPEMIAEREVSELLHMSGMYITWSIPIHSPRYHILDVYTELSPYASSLSTGSISISASPEGIYFCLDD